jgi:dephospho-CoA kinase
MLIIGITGGIGSGKSVVCKVFESLGVDVYDADSEARKLMSEDAMLIRDIKKQFGSEMYIGKDTLNRKKLADIVFHDAEALKKLNEIVHPSVKKHFKKWKKEHNEGKYLVKEAAILFESGANEDCTKVITVVAPHDLRVKRVVERDKVTKQQVENIMINQSSTSDKIKKSEFIIINDNNELVIPQVLELHEAFLKIYRDFK